MIQNVIYRVCKLKEEVNGPSLIVKGSKAVILTEPDKSNRVLVSRYGNYRIAAYSNIDNLIVGKK